MPFRHRVNRTVTWNEGRDRSAPETSRRRAAQTTVGMIPTSRFPHFCILLEMLFHDLQVEFARDARDWDQSHTLLGGDLPDPTHFYE